jgi:hypothetical protein
LQTCREPLWHASDGDEFDTCERNEGFEGEHESLNDIWGKRRRERVVSVRVPEKRSGWKFSAVEEVDGEFVEEGLFVRVIRVLF